MWLPPSSLVPKPRRAQPQGRHSAQPMPHKPRTDETFDETFATCAVALLAHKPARGLKRKTKNTQGAEGGHRFTLPTLAQPRSGERGMSQPLLHSAAKAPPVNWIIVGGDWPRLEQAGTRLFTRTAPHHGAGQRRSGANQMPINCRCRARKSGAPRCAVGRHRPSRTSKSCRRWSLCPLCR